MTEYIDRVQAMNIIVGGKNDKAYFGTTNKDWEVIDFLKIMPTADVVEQEKIDKAIKEMQDSKFDGKTVLTYNDAVNDCIKILYKLIKK